MAVVPQYWSKVAHHVAGNQQSELLARSRQAGAKRLDRVLDPENVSVQLDTLIKAVRAVGKEIEIKIDPHTRAS